ncbi:MAG TPA: hypothetical protein VF612_06575 [Jatrophihabitans sp.]|jgi:hypothetical protein|uniref:hypothetical protein n=1 Tax=Jatrophihabitans sp. TaxID=1932789 RepID=UPI002EFE29B2
MSKLATALAGIPRGVRRVVSRRPRLLLGSTVTLGSTLVLGLVLAGCAGSGRHPGAGSSVPATDSTAPSGVGTTPPAPCKQWSCVPEQPVQLGGGYSVRLWASAAPTAAPTADRSTPVLQLLHDGRHRQWWVGRAGFGWSAKLDCLAAGGAVPAHCVVLAEAGSHAGSAEVVTLRSGALASSPQASVSFDGGRPMAADLDHDGWLDVLGTENDYQPNYATGHNYWATYRFAEGSLYRTGCALRRTLAQPPPPDRLLTGDCPAIYTN